MEGQSSNVSNDLIDEMEDELADGIELEFESGDTQEGASTTLLSSLPVQRPIEGNEEGRGHVARNAEQRLFLEELEIRKRGRQLAIPTDDSMVRNWLRRTGEPVTFFGEGPYDRRERLRRQLARSNGSSSSQTHQLLANPTISASQIDDMEEFFVRGGEALLEVRRALLWESLEAARRRLEGERRERMRPPGEVRDERLALYEHIRRTTLQASQVGSDRPLTACALSPQGRLVVTGDTAGGVAVWRGADCSMLQTLPALHHSRIGAVLFNPIHPRQLAVCDADGLIALWTMSSESFDAAMNDQIQEDNYSAKTINQANRCEFGGAIELRGHTERVARIAYHPNGRLLGSASFDCSWRLWDVEHACELQLQEGHSRAVYSIAFHPDGGLAATGGLDAHGRIWDLRLGRAIWTLQGHLKTLLDLSFHPTRPLLASAGEDCAVRIWDLRKLQPIYHLPAHPAPISAVRWAPAPSNHPLVSQRSAASHNAAPGGSLLLTASFDGTAALWGSSDWKPLVPLRAHESKINAIDVLPDASLILTASHDRTFKLWSCPSSI